MRGNLIDYDTTVSLFLLDRVNEAVTNDVTLPTKIRQIQFMGRDWIVSRKMVILQS